MVNMSDHMKVKIKPKELKEIVLATSFAVKSAYAVLTEPIITSASKHQF